MESQQKNSDVQGLGLPGPLAKHTTDVRKQRIPKGVAVPVASPAMSCKDQNAVGRQVAWFQYVSNVARLSVPLVSPNTSIQNAHWS